MRHRKSGRKLKRTASHRKATLIALATAVIRHKKIQTTVAKAKEARMMVEKMITRAKNSQDVHARRMIGRFIKDRDVIGELFGDIAQKVGSRPGGYTRVIKLGRRFGDGAEVAVLELVDYNTGQDQQQKKARPDKDKEKKKKEKREKKERQKQATPATADF